jgi:hypothetical protein
MDSESIPNLGRDIVYDYQVVFDGGNNADVMYGVAEMYAWDTTKKYHSVRRPSADSLPWSQCVVLPGAKVECNANVTIAVAAFMFDNRQVIASLTADSPAATIGCSLGTVKDTFGLKVGNTGFVCTGVIVDETGRRYVYVRPFASAGVAAFDPKFTMISATSYNEGFYFFGDAMPSRLTALGDSFFKAAQASITTAPNSNNYYAFNANPYAYRGGVGFIPASRTPSPKRSTFNFVGENSIGAVEIPLPSPYDTTTDYIDGMSSAFILKDGLPRMCLTPDANNLTTVKYSIYVCDTHGGTITGNLITKSGTTQSVGANAVIVTTAAVGGAIDLVAGNDLLVGSGANQVRYKVSAAVAEPTQNTDATISITPNLSIELTGDEPVVLTPSWKVEYEADYANVTRPTTVNRRGFSGNHFVLWASLYNSSTGQYDHAPFHADLSGTSIAWDQLSVITYTNTGYKYEGMTITDVACTDDGEIYAIGSVTRTYSGTPEVGIFRYNGGAWTHRAVPAAPAGFTSVAYQKLCYLPDGRLLASVTATRDSDYSTYIFFCIIESDSAPVVLRGSEGVILIGSSGSTSFSNTAFVGCSSTGWTLPDGTSQGSNGDIYIYSHSGVRGSHQYVPLATPEYVHIPPAEMFKLSGYSATGTITGTLLTKAATTQPTSQAYITVTTAAGTGAIDLKDGDSIKVGYGATAITYTVDGDIAEADPATDVNIPILGTIQVELTGGEAVALRSGWKSRIEPLLGSDGNAIWFPIVDNGSTMLAIK